MIYELWDISKYFLLSLLSLLLFGYGLITEAPGVFSDITNHDGLQVSSKHKITSKDCNRGGKGWITNCDIFVQNTHSGEVSPLRVSVWFYDLHSKQFEILHNPKNGYLTTNISMEHIIGRLVSAIFMALLFITSIWMLYFSIYDRHRAREFFRF